MNFKQKIFAACLASLDEKVNSLKASLLELEEGSENDTKSSAGDKHETARAMMQIEQEKLGKQLNELLEQKSSVEKIDATAISPLIAKGSLVHTNKGILFVAAAIGKITVDEKPVMVLSPQSPLGIKLMGLKKHDRTEIKGIPYTILQIE
jgi:hypothetical protein